MSARELASYPKVWAVGSAAVGLIFLHEDEIVVQEKVDGSQISFGKIDGELVMRSKSQPLHADNPDGMFKLGVEAIVAVADNLPDNVIFRGEYLSRPKHNTLAYDRAPKNHIALFDAQVLNPITSVWEYDVLGGMQGWAADAFGFETVPELHRGVIAKVTDLTDLLERESFLGGPKIEGFVCKNYSRLTQFGDAMFAKYVSPEFKERHVKDWKNRNPTGKDFVHTLADEFATPARFTKGVQHLRERGEIENHPRDIGKLMKELAEDLIAEHKDYIVGRLWDQFGKDIVRGASRGAPEWYKARLLESAFEAPSARTEPFLAEVVGAGHTAFEQRWWCEPPPEGVAYEVVRDSWHADGNVRNIQEIRIAEQTAKVDA